MKAQTKILAALIIVSLAVFFQSCQTFMPSNILDDSQKVKGWLTEAGYHPKNNGYDIYKLDNTDRTKTFVKSYNFGQADDKIKGGTQLAERIKLVNDKVRFECTVDVINDYYLVRVWKSYLITEFSNSGQMQIEEWKKPYISETYLRIPDTDKEDFVDVVSTLESDFSMNYADFIDYHEQMLFEMQMEELEEEETEQDSVLTDIIK